MIIAKYTVLFRKLCQKTKIWMFTRGLAAEADKYVFYWHTQSTKQYINLSEAMYLAWEIACDTHIFETWISI
jgi:hypothetical protein